MVRIKLTRAYLHVGQLTGNATLKFTTESGGELEWSGFVNQKTGPVILEVPGDGQLYIEHSQLESVSFTFMEPEPCGESV